MKKLQRVPDVVILLLYLLIILTHNPSPQKLNFSSSFLKSLYSKRNMVTYVRVQYHVAI